MDRRVKERLVGASILAFLVVLIVPELLSGPAPSGATKPASSAPEPNRNVTIDLATRKSTSTEGAAAEAAASAASGGGAEPAAPPASTRAEPSVVTMPPAPPQTAPAPRVTSAPHTSPAPHGTAAAPAAPVERPAPPPTSTSTTRSASGHGWAVQLGVFASRANADKLVRQLKGQGFPVYVSSGGSASAPRYRVRVGPMPDRGAAAQTLAKLQSMGHGGALAAPGN